MGRVRAHRGKLTARGHVSTLAPTRITAAPAAMSARNTQLARAGSVSAHHMHNLLSAQGHVSSLPPTTPTAAPAAMPAQEGSFAMAGRVCAHRGKLTARGHAARGGQLARMGRVRAHRGKLTARGHVAQLAARGHVAQELAARGHASMLTPTTTTAASAVMSAQEGSTA